MSDNSHIEWTDATWNPIRARRKDGQPNQAGGGWVCQRVSPGCENCYAAAINKRLGTGFDYDAKGVAASDIYLDEKALAIPLRWRTPRKVFVCSMTDLFADWVPFEWIDRVFAVMALSPQHTFQVLTKRPERMREYAQSDCPSEFPAARRVERIYNALGGNGLECWPLPNVWLGTSVENQRWADERLPELLATPAAVRFVSCEPLLGPLDFFGVAGGACDEQGAAILHSGFKRDVDYGSGVEWDCDHQVGLDWIIVGGESGPGARAFDIAWARSIVEQCRAAGVAVFMKQLGARPVVHGQPFGRVVCGKCGLPECEQNWPGYPPHIERWRPLSRKGGEPEEWPEDLRVREMPV